MPKRYTITMLLIELAQAAVLAAIMFCSFIIYFWRM